MNTTKKPQSEEYKAFENLLGSVLKVSKSELDDRIKKAERRKRTSKGVSRAPAVPTKPA
jgi:hypothetical protein